MVFRNSLCLFGCFGFSYSELVEIHRIDEATATPIEEGAPLSEFGSNNKRTQEQEYSSPLIASGLFYLHSTEDSLEIEENHDKPGYRFIIPVGSI